MHEALDQTGALAGPLITALVLAHHGQYAHAFAWLGIPAALTVLSVFALRLRFPYAGELAKPKDDAGGDGKLSRAYWLYAASAALVAFGFADWPLIAYRFQQAHVVSQPTVPLLYAAAMAASGAAALALGRLFDARGFIALLPGHSGCRTGGATRVPRRPGGGDCRRAVLGRGAGRGEFGADGGRGASGAGAVRGRGPTASSPRCSASHGSSAARCLGALYDISIPLLVIVSVLTELAALIPFIMATRLTKA